MNIYKYDKAAWEYSKIHSHWFKVALKVRILVNFYIWYFDGLFPGVSQSFKYFK